MAEISLVSSSSCSNVSLIPTKPQVFINFRGELRKGFISFLVPALKEKNINVFIDEQEERGKDLTCLFDRIGESKIALVVFSEGYTESKWCLDELVQIKECMDQNKLRVIPIFYKIDPTVVKRLQGKFGDQFRDLEYRYKHNPERPQKWKEAMSSVCQTFALSLTEHSDTSDKDFVRSIVEEVSKQLPEEINGKIVQIDDSFSVPTNNLTITMCAAPNEEAVEVYCSKNMTENFQNKNQLPGQSYEVSISTVKNLGSRETKKGNVFMIDARELSITWSGDSNYWVWFPLPNKSSNESIVEIAGLRKVCWLDVAGKFDTRYLSPRTTYEVVFVVGLVKTKFKWKRPVTLKLVLPNSREKSQERNVNMVDHITNKWVDIPVGEFTTSNKNFGELSFAMYEHDCNLWKSGLFVKGVAIRPKYCHL